MPIYINASGDSRYVCGFVYWLQVLLTFGVLSLIMNLIVIGFSLYHFFHLEKARHKNYIANLKQDLNKARRALHSDDGKVGCIAITSSSLLMISAETNGNRNSGYGRRHDA